MLLKLAKELSAVLASNSKSFYWDGGYNSIVEPLVNTSLEFPEKPDNFCLEFCSTKQYKKVLLTSGGMDSLVMWKLNEQEKDKLAIYVDLGQEYAKKEMDFLAKSSIPALVIDWELKNLPRWKHIIPTRNLLLLALAEQYVAHEGEVWLGVVQGESRADSGDKSKLFMQLVQTFVWRTKRKWITIKTLEDKTKNDWLKWYIEQTNSLDILDTVTCFSSDSSIGCGRCQACVRKWIACRYCKLDTSSLFEIDPYVGGKEYINKYKQKFTECLKNRDFSHYSENRCKQDLQVILDYESNS